MSNIKTTAKFTTDKGIVSAQLEYNSLIELGETNDCVVRSIANAMEVSYDRAHDYAENFLNRKPNRGVRGWELKKMDGNLVLGKKVNRIGQVVETSINGTPWKKFGGEKMLGKWYHIGGGEKKYRRMSVGTFFKNYTKGTYIIVVSNHMFTYKDGVVMGNYSDAFQLKRPIDFAFEVI